LRMARLSERDWLQHGLKTLKNSGYTGLKADLMAKSLGVSRGSFYWHFKDLGAFQISLLDHWQKVTTEQVIEEIEQDQRATRPLENLMNRAFLGASQARLDQAVRLWAQHHPLVARRLQTVDTMRMEYLAKLFKENGLSRTDASRAARFTYAASLGDAQIPSQAWPRLTTEDVMAMTKVLTR
ncbi:MAG: TetR/AcrR family transcriptional regulator, partial [Pseudomonadota bacterium]